MKKQVFVSLLILILFLQFGLADFCGDSSGGILYTFNTPDANKHFMGITFNLDGAIGSEIDYFSFPSYQTNNSVLECCGNDLYIRRNFPENDVNEQKQIFKIPFLNQEIFNISIYGEDRKSCVGNDFYFTRTHDKLLCKSVSGSKEGVSCADPNDWNGFSLNNKCNIIYNECDNQKIFSATCDSWNSIPKGRYSECGGDTYFFSQYGLMKSAQGQASFEKLSDANFYYSKAFCNNLSGSNDFYITDKDNNLFKSIEGIYAFEKFNTYSLGGYFGGSDFYWQSLDGVYKSIGGEINFYQISETTTAFSKRFSKLYLPCPGNCIYCTSPPFYVNPVTYEFFWAEEDGNIIRSSLQRSAGSNLVMNISIGGSSSTTISVNFAKEYSFFGMYYRPSNFEDTQYILVKTKGSQNESYSTNSNSSNLYSNLNRITADYYYQNQNNDWMKISGDLYSAVNLFSLFVNKPELINNSYTNNGFQKAFSNYDDHTDDISGFDYLLYFNPLSTTYEQYTRGDDNAYNVNLKTICNDSYFQDDYHPYLGSVKAKASFKINSFGEAVEFPLNTLYGRFCGPNYYWRLENESDQLTSTILGSFENQLNYHNFGNYFNATYTYCALSKYFIFVDDSNNLHLIDNPTKREILCHNVSDLTKISVLKNGLVVCDSSSQNQIHSIKKFELDEPTLISNYDKVYGFCGDEFFYSKKMGDLNNLYSYNPKTNENYSLGGIDVSQNVFCKWNTLRWSYLGELKYRFLQNASPFESNLNYITSSDGFVNVKENANFINNSETQGERAYSHVLNCSDWNGFSKPECVGTFVNATKADEEMEITLNSKASGLVENNTRPLCGSYPYTTSCNDAYFDTKGICEFTCNYGYHKVNNLCIPNEGFIGEDCLDTGDVCLLDDDCCSNNCENNYCVSELVCEEDGVCNPECEYDPDCENCIDDGVCVDGCTPPDADCDNCIDDGVCVDGCTPPDPDCDLAVCGNGEIEQGEECEIDSDCSENQNCINCNCYDESIQLNFIKSFITNLENDLLEVDVNCAFDTLVDINIILNQNTFLSQVNCNAETNIDVAHLDLNEGSIYEFIARIDEPCSVCKMKSFAGFFKTTPDDMIAIPDNSIISVILILFFLINFIKYSSKKV